MPHPDIGIPPAFPHRGRANPPTPLPGFVAWREDQEAPPVSDPDAPTPHAGPVADPDLPILVAKVLEQVGLVAQGGLSLSRAVAGLMARVEVVERRLDRLSADPHRTGGHASHAADPAPSPPDTS